MPMYKVVSIECLTQFHVRETFPSIIKSPELTRLKKTVFDSVAD